jgi:prefoldin subunit 5
MDLDEQMQLLNQHIIGLQQQNAQLRHDLDTLAEALATHEGRRGKEVIFFKYLGRPSV